MSEKVAVASAIYDSIRARDVGHVFCVPGESYLASLNAFHGSNSPLLVATRHEEGAGLMAEAYAKATNKPGVCFVTRGPGLTHLTIALHTARQDSTPLVAIVGQVPTDIRHRDAVQETDIVAIGKAFAKDALEIARPDRAAELMQRAFHVATSGRPGPVVVALPEDVDRDSAAQEATRFTRAFPAAPSEAGLANAMALIAEAKAPCIVAGSGVLRADASAELVRFAERLGAPVYTAWRRFDAFPNKHDFYLGGLPSLPEALLEPVRNADLVLAIGTRLGELTTKGYSIPKPGQRLIHIDMGAEEAGGGFAGADIAMACNAKSALVALTAGLASSPQPARREAILAHRARYLSRTTPRPDRDGGDTVDPEGVYHDLRALVRDDFSVSSDAGTFGGWLTRFYRWNDPRTFFAPTAGGMGYALPAAIGAKLARPHAPALAIAGDGGFAMTMSELETAARMKLREFVVLVFNNCAYGTILKHQENHFPGRAVGTELGRIDFAGVADALGGAGFRVQHNKDFAPAFKAAIDCGKPAVIDIAISPARLDPWAG